MNEFNGLLTATVFLPALGALVLLIGPDNRLFSRFIATSVAAGDFVLAVLVFALFDRTDMAARFQFLDQWVWISSDAIKSTYLLGVDGLSAPLVLLTGLLGICAVLASLKITLKVKQYFIWILLLQTSVMGVFTSLDVLLFFLFWEVELIPMYMLITTWGSGRREYSGMKFLIFTIAGSAAMLVAILGLILTQGDHALNMISTLESGSGLMPTTGIISLSVLFWLFFIAFAIKLPVWPLHTWLPDAHTDAPTAASIILAGVMLKMGGYGLLRINVGMFPEQIHSFAWVLMILGVISVIYGGIVTVRQTDLKRLVAYSSVSHMGLDLVGIASVGVSYTYVNVTGLTGAAMQLFTHGTITGLLFLCVGLIYDKAHTRSIPQLGGVVQRMPLVGIAVLVAGFGSLGLPGLSGFVSEILIFFGAFPAFPILTVIAVLGIVLAAGYILWMIQRALFGNLPDHLLDLKDADRLESIPLILMIISIVVVGLYPSVVTDVFNSGLEPMVSVINNVSVINIGLLGN